MSPSKRQRIETAATDPNATARAASRSPLPSNASSTSSISHSDDGSPIRQFQRMEVAPRDPVRRRQLSVEDGELPSLLRDMVWDLSLLSNSRGVIHPALQASFPNPSPSPGGSDANVQPSPFSRPFSRPAVPISASIISTRQPSPRITSVAALHIPRFTHTNPAFYLRPVHRSVKYSIFTRPPRNATTRCTRSRRGTCSYTSGSSR